MNKKTLSLFLILTAVITTNLCAIKSLSEVLNDPRVIVSSLFLLDPTDLADYTKMASHLETSYNKLNNKYGDPITLSCEEGMEQLWQQLKRSELDGKLDEQALDKLIETFANFITQVRSKKEISENEILLFFSYAFILRRKVVELEFFVKNPTYLSRENIGMLVSLIKYPTSYKEPWAKAMVRTVELCIKNPTYKEGPWAKALEFFIKNPTDRPWTKCRDTAEFNRRMGEISDRIHLKIYEFRRQAFDRNLLSDHTQ